MKKPDFELYLYGSNCKWVRYVESYRRLSSALNVARQFLKNNRKISIRRNGKEICLLGADGEEYF